MDDFYYDQLIAELETWMRYSNIEMDNPHAFAVGAATMLYEDVLGIPVPTYSDEYI